MIAADEALRAAVLEALAANPDLAALDVRVGVLNATAHLAGEAPSEVLWRLAEAVVASVPDVRGVVNRIRAPGAPSPARTVCLSPSEDWSTRQDDQVP